MPKILPFDVPMRTVVRVPQLAEQLVEVPTIVSYSSLQWTVEHTSTFQFLVGRTKIWFNSDAFL